MNILLVLLCSTLHWVSSLANDFPPGNQTVKIPINAQHSLPPCWNTTNTDCGNMTIPFSLISSSSPFVYVIHNVPIKGSVIKSAVLTVWGKYCYDNSRPTQFATLQLAINRWNQEITWWLNPKMQCSPEFSMVVPTTNTPPFWPFWNYPLASGTEIDYGNTFVLSSLTPNLYFLITELQLELQTADIDPSVFVTYPVAILNPWSINEIPMTIQIGVKYFVQAYQYQCFITYDKYTATGTIISSSYFSLGFWLLTCEVSKQPAQMKLNYGQVFPAKVYTAPVLDGVSVYYAQTACVICERPRVDGVSPARVYPNETVTVMGEGFQPRGLGATIQVFKDGNKLATIDHLNENTDSTIIFTLPVLPAINVTVQICIKVSVNGQDYTQCTQSCELTYVGGVPTPPTSPPSPSDDLMQLFAWLNKNWWLYVVAAGVLVSIMVMIITFAILKVRNRKKSGDVTQKENDELDQIDPRALINISELTIREMIGSGSFAVVYRGYWRKTEVAIKMLQNNVKNEKISFLKESSLMLNLRHPHVVGLMGIVWNPRLCIITEYCGRGDVAEVMLDQKFIVEPEHIRKICLDTCRGMTYLHGANVIHRDLKSRNLLIDKDWNIKVADFGLARAFDEQPGTMTACGTPTHAAPEVIKHLHYTCKADVYSFGICLWEMCVRQEPYESIPGFQVIVAVATKRMRPKIPSTLDPRWASLIRRCWTEDPELRPDFQELVELFEEMRLPPPAKKMPYKEEDLASKKLSTSINSTSDSHIRISSNSAFSPPEFRGTMDSEPINESMVKATRSRHSSSGQTGRSKTNKSSDGQMINTKKKSSAIPMVNSVEWEKELNPLLSGPLDRKEVT